MSHKHSWVAAGAAHEEAELEHRLLKARLLWRTRSRMAYLPPKPAVRMTPVAITSARRKTMMEACSTSRCSQGCQPPEHFEDTCPDGSVHEVARDWACLASALDQVLNHQDKSQHTHAHAAQHASHMYRVQSQLACSPGALDMYGTRRRS